MAELQINKNNFYQTFFFSLYDITVLTIKYLVFIDYIDVNGGVPPISSSLPILTV